MFQLNTLKRKTEMKVVVDIMLGRIKRKRIFRQTNMDYKSAKFCKFTNENGKAYSLLALIPYENILYIEKLSVQGGVVI